MPVAVSDAALAATIGRDAKRERARRAVATEFLELHVFEPDPKKDWNVVRRILQTIDLGQPVVVGPPPPAPRRLAALSPKGGIGVGFFADAPPAGTASDFWIIMPEAVYLKFFTPFVWVDAAEAQRPSEARYFIPWVRNPKGPRVALRDRS